jgi:hypothetical protein
MRTGGHVMGRDDDDDDDVSGPDDNNELFFRYVFFLFYFGDDRLPRHRPRRRPRFCYCVTLAALFTFYSLSPTNGNYGLFVNRSTKV